MFQYPFCALNSNISGQTDMYLRAFGISTIYLIEVMMHR